MERDDGTRIQVQIKTALMSPFILYPSKKFLAILEAGG
jgi:hypothetical protein